MTDLRLLSAEHYKSCNLPDPDIFAVDTARDPVDAALQAREHHRDLRRVINCKYLFWVWKSADICDAVFARPRSSGMQALASSQVSSRSPDA